MVPICFEVNGKSLFLVRATEATITTGSAVERVRENDGERTQVRHAQLEQRRVPLKNEVTIRQIVHRSDDFSSVRRVDDTDRVRESQRSLDDAATRVEVIPSITLTLGMLMFSV